MATNDRYDDLRARMRVYPEVGSDMVIFGRRLEILREFERAGVDPTVEMVTRVYDRRYRAPRPRRTKARTSLRLVVSGPA